MGKVRTRLAEIAIFEVAPYERVAFEEWRPEGHAVQLHAERLIPETADCAADASVISVFVH